MKQPNRRRLSILSRFQGDITNDQFEDWLGQFLPEERPIIERLTAHFQYFSANAVNDAVIQLYKNIVAHLNVKSIDSTKAWYVPVGYVAKSGSLISYMFRKRNDIPYKRFVSLTDLDVTRIAPTDTVILLDDFLGSGAQAVDVWSHLSERLPQPITRRVLLGVLIAQERGIRLLESDTKIEAVSTKILTEADMAFSSTGGVFKDERERERAFNVIQKYGQRLYPEYPDGFNKSQSLIGFFYSTPNNTLPIYWSTVDGWRPLLPRSESFRDPSSLIGPPRFLDRAIVTSSDKPIVDTGRLDEMEFGPEVASAIFGEFRLTSTVFTFGKVLSQLSVKFDLIPGIIRLMKELAELTHEQKFVPSAIAIVPDVADLEQKTEPVFTLGSDLTIANIEEVKNSASVLEHANCVLVFDRAGRLVGGYPVSGTTGTADAMVPDSLIELAKFSNRHECLVFYFSAPSRIHLLYGGHRILLRRGTGWHLQASTLNRAVAELARLHSVSQEVIRQAIHVAFQLSDLGKGAMLTLGDHQAVVNCSDPPKSDLIKFGTLRLGASDAGTVVSLAAQDGATIISDDGTIHRVMAFLRVPSDVAVEEELGKGVRHSTAARVSKITKALVFAVSSDGRITAYSQGSVKFKVMG